MLLWDESADEKAGLKSVGAARQYNGRLGKVDLSQVGVFLAYSNISPTLEAPVWTWVDGEVFLPEPWFAEALACDDLYGRSTWFRRQLAQAGIVNMADVPATTQVFLQQPTVGVPPIEPGHKERPPSRPKGLSEGKRVAICDLFAVRRVWTDRDAPGVPTTDEWAVIRQETDGKLNCSLSNAPAASTIEHLAWQHQLALTVPATWFIAETKLDWARRVARDPTLTRQFEVEVLPPLLSTANVREMLRAAMPLPQLSVQHASALVVKHLVNRTRAKWSRIKHRHSPGPAP